MTTYDYCHTTFDDSYLPDDYEPPEDAIDNSGNLTEYGQRLLGELDDLTVEPESTEQEINITAKSASIEADTDKHGHLQKAHSLDPPPELLSLPIWGIQRNKVPKQWRNPKQNASPTNRDHWGKHKNVVEVYRDLEKKYPGEYGLAIAFFQEHGLFGVDLDNVIIAEGERRGKLKPHARAIVESLNTYTEFSPSGSGVHCIGIGKKPEGLGCRKSMEDFEIEIYDCDRYFTFTGDSIWKKPPRPVKACLDELTALCEMYLSPAVPHSSYENINKLHAPGCDLSDKELLARLRTKPEFARLYDDGDYTGVPMKSPDDPDEPPVEADGSAADAILIGCFLDELGGDVDSIYRLMQDAAIKREKWQKRRKGTDYLRFSIQRLAASRLNKQDARDKDLIGKLADLSDDDLAELSPQGVKPRGRIDITQGKAVGLRIVHGDKLGTGKPRPYLVKGWLDQKSMAQFYGPTNIGKSLVVLDMALHLSNGVPWADNRTTPTTVVYLAAEGEDTMDMRVAAFKQAHEMDCGDFHVIGAPIALGGDDTSGIQALTELCYQVKQKGKPMLIIIDTFAQTNAGEENSATDVGKYTRQCLDLKDELDATVLLVHHTGHGETGRARGSSALPAAVDTSLRLQMLSPTSKVLKLSSDKQRAQAKDGGILAIQDYQALGVDDDGELYGCPAIEILAQGDERVNEGHEGASLTTAAKRCARAMKRIALSVPEGMDSGKHTMPEAVIEIASLSAAIISTYPDNGSVDRKTNNKRSSRTVRAVKDSGELAQSECGQYCWLIGVDLGLPDI